MYTYLNNNKHTYAKKKKKRYNTVLNIIIGFPSPPTPSFQRVNAEYR